MEKEPQGEEFIEPDEEIIEEEGLKDKIKKIRKELEAARKERDEYLSGWQRAKADFINARKEDEKLKEETIKFAESSLLGELLLVSDSLELALKSESSDEGLRQIHSQLHEIFKNHGISVIEAMGKKFNPAEHEALEKIETNKEGEDGIIVEELQRGYRLYDRVLRPARVKVGVLKK